MPLLKMMVDAQHNGAGTPIINNNTRKESKPARDFFPSLRGVGNLLNYHVGIFPSRDLSSSNLISDLLKTLFLILLVFSTTRLLCSVLTGEITTKKVGATSVA
jgi:hypothetical protein